MFLSESSDAVSQETRVTRFQNALDDVAGNIYQALEEAEGDPQAQGPGGGGRRRRRGGGCRQRRGRRRRSWHQGRAVQVDPMKPQLKLPGTKRLKLECDVLLSTSAFKFNVRRYTTKAAKEAAKEAAAEPLLPKVRRRRLTLT